MRSDRPRPAHTPHVAATQIYKIVTFNGTGGGGLAPSADSPPPLSPLNIAIISHFTGEER